jgi:hypothetical protein
MKAICYLPILGGHTLTRPFWLAKQSSRGESYACRLSPGFMKRSSVTTTNEWPGITSKTSCKPILRQAEAQLDIAINCGRHAELFAYDDDTGELYLESSQEKIAEKSFALTELYEAWPVLSRRERVEGCAGSSINRLLCLCDRF